MRAALIVALDLSREAARSPALWVLAPFLSLYLPFQHGVVDGLATVSFVSVRLSLSASAVMPSIAMLALFMEVILPRKLAGAMEPLLASPLPDRDLLIGHALPVLGLQLAAVAAGIPVAMIGYRLADGCWPPEALSDALFMGLAGPAVGLLLLGASARALMAARSALSFSLRTLPVAAALVPLDVLLMGMRWAGYRRACLGIPLFLMAAGVAWLAWAMRRLDREMLLMR